MNDDRLQDVFDRARRLDCDERQRYLDNACGHDRELRREVEALLAHTDDFPDDPAPLNVRACLQPEKEKGPLPEQAVASDEELTPALQEASETDPQHIGRYRVERRLGKGGYGRVYLAHDDELGRPVAIKVPHRRRIKTPDDIEAYIREARIVARLEHPGIVPVHDVGRTDDGLCYVVSKYVEGGDLAAKIKESRPSHIESAELVATIADALTYTHSQDLVHRDIKPANIVLDAAGRPYLTDFGIAIKEEDSGQRSGMAGTLPYTSPEQARGESHRVDGRSDIFSLGVVFYELLTGRRPFRAENSLELIEQITTVEPSPLRQRDHTIPKELERICLRALSKRVSGRYLTAMDLADDLRHFLEKAPGAEQPAAAATPDSPARNTPTPTPGAAADPTAPATPSPVASDSDKLIKIVPKGLRSFDAEDADFFLELLPGPRDRDGLPDSIRFWKNRIEEPDPDKTFAVGLIYGPSGCGKSSLMKAGLLPRLADSIIAVYIEATAEETELRLLRGLQKYCPDLLDGVDLSETLAAMRRGRGVPSGKKVLIVLDQFEQWLHAKREKENTELVQALRQCDGEHLQCIVMVRDDFWMAATSFMQELEIRLLEGHNSTAVGLFDLRHAKRVLTAFGRAFGTLSEEVGELTNEQRIFLEQATSGLAQEGKIVCVRLALFAEMMKGRSWDPPTLKNVGGTEGLGVTFLEETFSANTAPPEHRLHQKAARDFLKVLLPEIGTDIKGHIRSYRKLLEASGYADRPRDFEHLLRILDGELRLVTPTEPEGLDSEDEAQLTPEGQYCQLTHDYLVHPLRDWLTRKQRETHRGRADLRLDERSALWNTKSDNRHLPAWWEYGNIRLLTDKKNWTEPQRKMMGKAGRIHGLRWGSALLVTLLIGITIQQIVAAVRHSNLAKRVQTTVSSLNTGRGIILPRLRDLDEFPREMMLTELRSQFAAVNDTRKLPLAFAMAHFGDVRVDFLVLQVENALPDEVDNFVAALGKSRPEAVTAMEATARTSESEKKWRHKARLAMLTFHLNAPTLAKAMCHLQPDPIQRAWFIEECSTWHGDLTALAKLVVDTDDGPLRCGVALAVGSVAVADVTVPDKREWETVLREWYTTEPDTLTHSTAGWILRKWKLELPEIAASKRPVENRNWYVNSVGMTLLKIPAGSFVIKDRGTAPIDIKVTLTRSFLLADREVTRAQFWRFIDDRDYPDKEKKKSWRGANREISPTKQHPVQEVDWYDAVLFCNWLSRQEGLTPSYERTGETEKWTPPIIYEGVGAPVGRIREYDAWRLIPEANGYRLPTEAEWEHACRAGTVTRFSHGNDESLLDRYAVYDAERTELTGSKLPNGWGLFDVHGNVSEWCHDWWCHDWYGRYEGWAVLTDPIGLDQGTGFRVVRGGEYESNSRGMVSCRLASYPDISFGGCGIRVARTYR